MTEPQLPAQPPPEQSGMGSAVVGASAAAQAPTGLSIGSAKWLDPARVTTMMCSLRCCAPLPSQFANLQKPLPRKEMQKQIQSSMVETSSMPDKSALVVKMKPEKLSDYRRGEFHKELRSIMQWDKVMRPPTGALDAISVSGTQLGKIVEHGALTPTIWLMNLFQFGGYQGLSQEELQLLADKLHPLCLPRKSSEGVYVTVDYNFLHVVHPDAKRDACVAIVLIHGGRIAVDIEDSMEEGEKVDMKTNFESLYFRSLRRQWRR